MINNDLRISGLASGMDIDSIVKKLMKAENIPLDKMKQDKQILEWQRDHYRDINKLLLDLKTKAFDMSLQGSYLTKLASSTNESKVTATAGSNAGNATYTMSDALLATSAHNQSIGVITKDGFDPDKSLADMKSFLNDGSTLSEDFTMTTFDQNGQPKSETFNVDPSKSLNDIFKKINDSDLGVNAFYDSATKVVSITRTDTGDMNANGSEMAFSGDFLTATLGLDSSKEEGGTDAQFTLNGLATHRHSNTFTVNGVTFNLKGNMAAGEQASINTTNDVDTVFTKIKDFVDKYNEVIEKVNDKLAEKRYRDYNPLTDAQKKDMDEKDIELWNEKAQSGLLSHDNMLSSALRKMRMNFYNPVKGVSDSGFDQLAEIGIKVSSSYRDNGKLEIDEAKLKQALSENPQAVKELFTATGESDDRQGIAQRLDQTVKDAMIGIEQKAGKSTMTDTQYFIGKRLDNMDDRIDAFQDHLTDVENRYYRQFTAMEQAIQRANQQAAYLANQFGGGQ
ncbi:flagellar hook-associated protein 2 [Scopulibacillus darangshiensis]|uniref:Flagellar hook-associated protein 2 n=1 Tax=Scopulibacillus darangshiensis TaxID=442528 RepID=A0A4R2NVB8_9BACL|nr:flagellar hook-associated protein 2 [Scopulibacillus darangshiensis]TCP26033.1 flagellar hook-associated protein 2 [Scopulibacillus darangshiensis]